VTRAAVLSVLCLAAACRLEDRTPAGTRRDEIAVQQVVAAYYRAGADSLDLLLAPFATGSGIAGSPAVQPLRAALLAERGALGRDDEGRPVRQDIRLAGDIATVWVTWRAGAAGAAGDTARRGERMEVLVLRRLEGGWRVTGATRSGPP